MLESIAEPRLGGEGFEPIGIRVRYREKKVGGKPARQRPAIQRFGLEPSQYQDRAEKGGLDGRYST
jgi:hypothetical protein